MALAPQVSLARIALWDERALQRVAAVRTRVRTAVLRVFTETPVWLSILILVLGVGGKSGFLSGALWGVLVAGVASGLGLLVKFTVRRARPSVAYCVARTLDRYSFPSGHSTAAFAVVAASFLVCPAFFPLVLLGAAAVAFSRVYLGVHYLSDVVGGAVMGLLLGGLTVTSAWAPQVLALLQR